MTDRELLSEIQLAVVEPDDEGATWPSGLWSVDEVLGYLNQRQDQFLRDTAIVSSLDSLDVDIVYVDDGIALLPGDWIVTLRAVWKRLTSYRPLQRMDSWVSDHTRPSWPSVPGTPSMFQEFGGPTLELQLSPIPDVSGSVELLYVALGTELDGSGVDLVIPDEFAPYIKWGVLSDMLSKIGRGQDMTRAQYAEQRFQEGIELARLMLKGRRL
jgi:hypothetical protein